jgi:hypothetical protein
MMAAPPSVREGGASLRSACSTDAETVAKLESGTPVALKFAFSGDLGTCYKVAAGDKTGYVLASELQGLETYEQARATATDRGLPQMIRAEIGRLKEQAGLTGGSSSESVRLSGAASPTVAGAIRMLEMNQPKEALEILETSLLRSSRQDAFLLSLAGLAAFQSDQPRRAVEYWTESLSIKPNPSVQNLLQRAQRELGSDTSRTRIHGGRFNLRYNESDLTRAQADSLLSALDAEYSRLDTALGCGLQEQLTAVVMKQDAYRAATGAAEWSSGVFDGRIRVMIPNRGIDAGIRETLAHEIVHACIARNGQFPGWFHEGMAQHWSGEKASSYDAAQVRARLRSRQMPSLNNLSATFSRMSADHARLAYAFSWMAVDAMYRQYGDQYVRNVLRNPSVLPQVADQITRALAAE